MNAQSWWWGFGREHFTPIRLEDGARLVWAIWNGARILHGQDAIPWPEAAPHASPLPPRAPVDENAQTLLSAARLLGVSVEATPDEIRAALRAKMADGAHPDHGGDEAAAKRLIAAKNLLIEHARRAS